MDDKGTIWEQGKDFTKPQGIAAETDDSDNFKSTAATIIALIVLFLIAVGIFRECMIKVNAPNYAITQSVTGRMGVIDRPGYHIRPFATSWTFRKYSTIKMESNLVFRLGGLRKVKTYAEFKLPERYKAKFRLHEIFNGSMHNIEKMVEIATTNAIKIAACTMTVDYFDNEGKREIVNMVRDQLENGLYKLTAEDVLINGRKKNIVTIATNEDGSKVHHDKGLILTNYGLELGVFSIIEIIYPVDETVNDNFQLSEHTFPKAVREVKGKLSSMTMDEVMNYRKRADKAWDPDYVAPDGEK